MIILKENEIGAPSCSHGIKKLATTTAFAQATSSKPLGLSRRACAPVTRTDVTTTQKSPEPLVLADGGDDHSSDLAATEFRNCKKKVCIFYP